MSDSENGFQKAAKIFEGLLRKSQKNVALKSAANALQFYDLAITGLMDERDKLKQELEELRRQIVLLQNQLRSAREHAIKWEREARLKTREEHP